MLALGGLGVVWVGIKLVSYKIKLAAALRAEEERSAIADEETMKQHVWDGDKAYQTHVRAEDIRRRIKDTLVERKNEGRPPAVV